MVGEVGTLILRLRKTSDSDTLCVMSHPTRFETKVLSIHLWYQSCASHVQHHAMSETGRLTFERGNQNETRVLLKRIVAEKIWLNSSQIGTSTWEIASGWAHHKELGSTSRVAAGGWNWPRSPRTRKYRWDQRGSCGPLSCCPPQRPPSYRLARVSTR